MTAEILTPALSARARRVDVLKWGASLVQIGGYSATGLGHTSVAVPLFLVGVVGWLAVGLAWRDKAIILIHIVALAAMLVGLATRG